MLQRRRSVSVTLQTLNLSFHLGFIDIRKWFRIWGVDDLLERSGDAMYYVMIEERLVESLRINWEDANRTNLEYYIANVNLEC